MRDKKFTRRFDKKRTNHAKQLTITRKQERKIKRQATAGQIAPSQRMTFTPGD